MVTRLACAGDGVRVAYDRTGWGTPLVLLHGGFVQDRRIWHDEGYVERLSADFDVVAIDLRGHGESDRPIGPAAYSAENMIRDVHAVLDAECMRQAVVWGYSYGALVALQLAMASQRVTAAALGGAVLGPWLTADAAAETAVLLERAANGKARGELDDLPPDVRSFVEKADVRVAIDTYRAIPSWPLAEPEALRCATLFYTGSKSEASLASLAPYQSRLDAVGARRVVLEGLDHEGELHAIDRAIELCSPFLRGSGRHRPR